MPEVYLSQIILWALNWAPEGWAICAGQSLPVSQYQALYSLIGNTYGGNTVNFNLPDLRGRAPIGFGLGTGLNNNYQYGKPYGAETNTLLVANLPPHTHSGSTNTFSATGGFMVSNGPATSAIPDANSVLAVPSTNAVEGNGGDATVNIFTDTADPASMISLNNALSMNISGGGSFVTDPTGSGMPISNIPPFLALNYLMCIQGGLYPVRPTEKPDVVPSVITE